MKKNKRVMITLTSSMNVDEKYLELTKTVSKAFAENGLGIVFGGTAYGMMKELAQIYKDSGGDDLVGVMAEDLMKVTKGYVAYEKLDESYLMPSMEERKLVMIEKSDAFLILPGGYGTLEEIGSIIGGRANKLYDKPIAILNLDGFYDQFLEWMNSMQEKKFSKINYKDIIFVSEDIEEIMKYFNNYKKEELQDKFV